MRTKEYCRNIRIIKIIKRKNKIRQNLHRNFNPHHLKNKDIEILYGDKSGYLNKNHYGWLTNGIKTKTKNKYASYRHKGGYGKAILYSRHDRRQIIRMDQEIHEYKEG